ncbi:MAG TPA: Hsp20/alpha crystallin family protein [Thermodesulfovibrionales bacterium]|nr:Hsp20/alpha crystallin family protein [Thermodesulfovibrionales bacterium]
MLWSDLERFGRVLDPWHELEGMSRALRRAALPSTLEFPATNVWVSEDSAVVTTEVPGIDPDALEISVLKDSLTLRGSRPAVELREEESYHRKERWSGQFTKTLQLPFPVDPGKVEARFAKGVLRIALPRAEADRPRKIPVKSE